MKLRCRFGLHAWSAWLTTHTGKTFAVKSFTSERRLVGLFVVQERTCADCKLVQLREESTESSDL